MALADTAELVVALNLRDGVSPGLTKLNRQLKGMSGGLSQVGKGIGQLGSGLDKIVTRGALAGGAALAGVITTAASFEQAWAGVEKTVEGANDALLNDFKQLSREIPLSFEELAAIGAEGGALGIATKDLTNFTDIVARLAVSTDLSAEQASSALGQLANVLDLQDADLRDFGDSLVALGNDGASTESQIIDLTSRFGAAGKQAGLSTEAILALASTTASMAIEAEAGGGALSRIFNGITLDIGTASEESQHLADAMGLSLGELRTAWDHDAGAVFGDLLEHINKLDKFDAAKFLKDLGITNSRDINAISLLASGVEEYNRQLDVSTGQTDELNRESDAFFDTTEGKWEILKNNVRLAADTIGSELLPIVNEAMEDFTDWLALPNTQRGLEDFATDLAGGIRDVVTEIRSADLTPLLEVVKGAASGAKAAFDTFRGLPPEVQQLALAAFGINKVTGGALTDVAKGFGNIFGGALKLAIPALSRGITPANPMFVKEVGIGGKGPGGPVPTGGGKFPLLPVAGALTVPLILSGSDNPTVEMENRRIQLARDLDKGIIDAAEAARLWADAYGKTVRNPFVSGVNPFGLTTAEGRAALARFNVGPKKPSGIEKITATLPDTAMAPMIGELAKNRTESTTRINLLQGEFARTGSKLDVANARLAILNATLAAKRFDPKITTVNNITVPVSVNASVIQRQIYTIRTTTGGGGFI